jgi:hypothetical protein
MPSYFVFIISSRDDPLYEVFDSIRRKQLNALGIPYKFLLNGVLPEGYVLKSDEELSPDGSYTPGMFLKFYYACKNLLGSAVLPSPDFIMRVNSSTYVDFSKVEKFLMGLPKNKCRAGYPLTFYCDNHRLFLAGTAMIFSTDVINHLINDVSLEDPVIYNSPDDCSLSVVTDKYCDHILFNIKDNMEFFQEDKLDFSCIKPHSIFFRVKNTDREKNDVLVWETLYCQNA